MRQRDTILQVPSILIQHKVNTDWSDAAFKTGVRQNHNINLSGGGAASTYNIGLDYFSQQGTIEGAWSQLRPLYRPYQQYV